MINKRAQTLTELATFGTILLLVLSFFISYGMRYNYQQDVQMRAFRMAMSAAYKDDRPDPSATITLVEDKHVPDPRDTFGVGNIVPIQSAGAQATWGNTMQNRYNVPDTKQEYDANPSPFADLLPRVKYNINGEIKEYTTAGYLYTAFTGNRDFYVEISGLPREEKNISVMKIYDPVPAEDPQHPGSYLPATQVMVLLNSQETEVVSALAIRKNGPLMPIIKVLPANGKHGDPVSNFVLLDPESGSINLAYTQLNNDVDNNGTPGVVTPDNLQGLWPEDMAITRHDQLIITQAPGVNQVKSTNIPDFTATITHKIKSKAPDSDKVISAVSYKKNEKGSAVWEIKKLEK